MNLGARGTWRSASRAVHGGPFADFEEGRWRFVAIRGTREVAEIAPETASVPDTIWVSNYISLTTPEPTQRPGRPTVPARSSEPAGDEEADEGRDDD